MTKTLNAQQITLNLVSLIQQAADPSAGGGVAAAIGSLYLRDGTGQMWLKTGAGATAWQKLVQSFSWYVVKDYGATGDGVTDDTTAIQAAITACNAAGGGVVFFPPGTYAVTQLALTGTANVQIRGSGTSSIIKWVWNAATAAGSMITISAGATNTRLEYIRLDGSSLTNPSAARDNHLVKVVGAGGGVTTTHFYQCQFGAMAAASGDGIHIVGTAGNLVSRLWIIDNNFDGCSRFSVGVEQGWQYGFIQANYMTNCTTEIGFVSTANVNTNAITICENRLVHTSATRHAMRLEGDATGLITRITCGNNSIIGGFVSVSNTQWAAFVGNLTTSGAFASTDGVWRFFDACSFSTFAGGNLIDRDPGASAGPLIAIEKATSSPSMLRVGGCVLLNEKDGSFIKVVDATQIAIGTNVCHSTDAGASAAFGIDVQAVTVNMTSILVGPGNQFTTSANQMLAAVRFLANGANVTDVSCVGNQADSTDYGVQFEIGGGGGTFNGQVMYSGNNMDSGVGDIHNVGVTVRPRIGLNAGTFGSQYFQGTGSPEGVVTARVSSVYARTDGGQASSLYYKESGTGNTGWVALGGDPIVFGANDLTTVATAVFLAPGFVATAGAGEIKVTATRPGTIRNLRVQIATAGTDSQTVTYTVRKNGVDTALTTTKDNAANGAASDTTHSFTVVAGDLLSISVVKAGAVTAGQTGVTASVELV